MSYTIDDDCKHGCGGHYEFKLDGECTCHVNPPCLICVRAPLVCTGCEDVLEDDDHV